MNDRCIICNNLDAEFTLEHIIPFALGNNNFYLRNVCKKCNSLIGEKIDVYSTNNIMAELMRMTKKVPGHSGKIPFPFAKGKTEDGFTVKLSLEMKPTIEPKVSKNENKYNIITGSHDEAINIAEKILKRNGKPPLSKAAKEIILSKVAHKEHPRINYSFELNINMLKIEAIKIVFETVVYKLGTSCLQEAVVEKMQNVIFKYIYEDVLDIEFLNENVSFIDGAMFNSIRDALQVTFKEGIFHIIHFTVRENDTVVTVIVEGMLPMAVKLDTVDLINNNSLIIVGYPGNLLINE
ncbi:MAG: hypothetical protein IKL82_02425 [Clostridia bacterium]|nr:hypothetical protein [Clostridia bacterium]